MVSHKDNYCYLRLDVSSCRELMMNIESILVPERTCCNLEATSKKRAIEEAAKYIAETLDGLEGPGIYEQLISREKLGTTAIGHGIAIPHCRMDNCDQIVGGLFKLDRPVDFGAFDEEDVQIMFVLLVPSQEVEDHLQTLAMLAERFESAEYRKKLLAAHNDQELYELALRDPLPNARRA